MGREKKAAVYFVKWNRIKSEVDPGAKSGPKFVQTAYPRRRRPAKRTTRLLSMTFHHSLITTHPDRDDKGAPAPATKLQLALEFDWQ